jgi:hypothetical protein
MNGTNGTIREENARASTSATRFPPCPVCEGVLLPLGKCYRCSRCQWSVCLGCEGGGAALEPIEIVEQ